MQTLTTMYAIKIATGRGLDKLLCCVYGYLTIQWMMDLPAQNITICLMFYILTIVVCGLYENVQEEYNNWYPECHTVNRMSTLCSIKCMWFMFMLMFQKQ